MVDWIEAETHLKEADPKIAKVIEKVGCCELSQVEGGFAGLSSSIIGQQLSNKVAKTIRDRYRKLFENETPSAKEMVSFDDEILRKVGLSYSKIKYVRGLAEWLIRGDLVISEMEKLEDEKAIATLVQIKGIGRWTAEMYLMFSLNRPDILPLGDAAIEAAMKRIYELPEKKWENQATNIAEKWKPWRTVACWYLYRYHGLVKANKDIF